MSDEEGNATAPSPPPRSWWGGLTGILTGTTALVTALVGLLAGLQQMGLLGHARTPAPPLTEQADGAVDGETRIVAPPTPEALQEPATPSRPTWILGTWTWKGQPCAAGPRVSYEGKNLVFVTPSSKFVHRVLDGGPDQLRTEVTLPHEHEGEIYEFRVAAGNLSVFEEATRTRDVWNRCL
jgi:hypothetical protein